jgi:hypothetical protein
MKIISEQKLDNSLCVKITDQSRRVAGDRWYIKVVCEVRLFLTDRYFETRQQDGPEQLFAIRRLLGDEIGMELVQERNFIDAAARPEVVSGMLASVAENISGYLSSDAFPARLFAIRYGEAKKLSQAEMILNRDEREETDDEGPADFSACFRD